VRSRPDLVVMAVGISRTPSSRNPPAALQPRHRRERHHADFDPKIYASEMRAHRVPPTDWSRRCRDAKVCANHLANFGIGRYAGR